jgi:hypothetical protein
VKASPGRSDLCATRSAIVHVPEICSESDHLFDGTLLYLTTKHSWNSPGFGIVDTTSSFCLNDDCAAKYCFSRRCEKENYSMNTSNQWQQLNFKNISIVVTHYSNVSRNAGCKGGFDGICDESLTVVTRTIN